MKLQRVVVIFMICFVAFSRAFFLKWSERILSLSLSLFSLPLTHLFLEKRKQLRLGFSPFL